MPTIKAKRLTNENQSPGKKALHTAKWARIMTKWLITHSSKGGVKWQVVNFNGARGHEAKGIVDLIASRKNHGVPETGKYRGDLFEIILVQVKGGGSRGPSQADIERLEAVRSHHAASKVVLAEWKKGKKLCCYILPNITDAVDAKEVFGKIPTSKRISDQVTAATIADQTNFEQSVPWVRSVVDDCIALYEQ